MAALTRILPLALLCLLLVSWACGSATPFSCSPLPPPPPAVDGFHVRPGNVKAIMAMGDSISAGFAMSGNLIMEQRGLVFSIGDQNLTKSGGHVPLTVPRFLKHYNQQLVGGALGETIPKTAGFWLDAAISGAKINSISSQQIPYLIKQLQGPYSPYVDYEKDWKLLTYFIGANNVCVSCKESRKDVSGAYYEDALRTSLLELQQIPRLIVNLMHVPYVSGVYRAGVNSAKCQVIWSIVSECRCMAKSDAARTLMDEHTDAYNAAIDKVALEFRGNSTFVVNVQPFLSSWEFGELGEKFFSKLDCFHPALYGDEYLATYLWNSMFAPADKKPTTFDANVTPYCPTKDDFIQ